MPIRFNNQLIGAVKYGSNSISRVYHGSTPVWSADATAPIKIPWEKGKSYYDVAKYYEDYQNLTEDNFFINQIQVESISEQKTVNLGGTVRVYAEYITNYDPETGHLEMYIRHYMEGQAFVLDSRPPFVVLVQHPADLEELILITQDDKHYNLSQVFPDYYKFTTDNFLIKPNNNSIVDTLCNYTSLSRQTFDVTGTMTVENTYDNTTGILTCYTENVGQIKNVTSLYVPYAWTVLHGYMKKYLSRVAPV